MTVQRIGACQTPAAEWQHLDKRRLDFRDDFANVVGIVPVSFVGSV